MRPNKFSFIAAAVLIALSVTLLAPAVSSASNIGATVPQGKIDSPDSPETKGVLSQKYFIDPEKAAGLKKKIYELIVQTEEPYSVRFGSGVVFENNGQLVVITANHVIANKPKVQKIIYARDHTGQLFRCKILRSIPENDLAIMEIEDSQNILPETVVRSLNKVNIEETIYACGYYNGVSFVKIGKITGFYRKIHTESGTIYGIIESNAQIGPGFSGGQVLNEKDELIGIIVAMDMDLNYSYFSSLENIANILKTKLPR
jgi:S1-C subfamily serine protease